MTDFCLKILLLPKNHYKKRYSLKPKYRKYVMVMVICHLQEHLEINMVKN